MKGSDNAFNHFSTFPKMDKNSNFPFSCFVAKNSNNSDNTEHNQTCLNEGDKMRKKCRDEDGPFLKEPPPCLLPSRDIHQPSLVLKRVLARRPTSWVDFRLQVQLYR